MYYIRAKTKHVNIYCIVGNTGYSRRIYFVFIPFAGKGKKCQSRKIASKGIRERGNGCPDTVAVMASRRRNIMVTV